jgi:hypothetical protein
MTRKTNLNYEINRFLKKSLYTREELSRCINKHPKYIKQLLNKERKASDEAEKALRDFMKKHIGQSYRELLLQEQNSRSYERIKILNGQVERLEREIAYDEEFVDSARRTMWISILVAALSLLAALSAVYSFIF